MKMDMGSLYAILDIEEGDRFLEHVELQILDAVEWDVSCPVAETFLQLMFVEKRAEKGSAAGPDPQLLVLSRYLCQVALVHGGLFTNCLPSILAEAGMYLAEKVLGRSPVRPSLYVRSLSDELATVVPKSKAAIRDIHYIVLGETASKPAFPDGR